MPTEFRRSPIALAILGLLEAGPSHPYAIQQLIKQWGKDQVVNVGQRATLYKVITRLQEAGMIAVRETDRDHRYPERTTYEVTGAGSAAARQWLTEILSTPRNEFPEFPAALSFLALITPEDTLELLDDRREKLVRRIAELDATLAEEFGNRELPRVSKLETEYVKAVTEAELRWTTAVLDDLRDGSLSWDRAQLDAIAAQAAS
ncbi:PadR family transcriptional regulator [Amycolatopsis nigrescens]|uniref:PadR family transcriptional regulator n=1 Tax=Amycolatopsis nigrescens TaxID=381445 RepID=UPI000378D447|nr:PadR family transcriptional regulator [Amycolatopsis nigrescens]